MSDIAARYTIVALPFVPTSINAKRQVAGTTEAHRAAFWAAKGGLTELPLPEGFTYSEAVDINGSGHVLLMAYDRTFSGHQAYIFADGLLRPLPGNNPRAFRINDSDEVAGEAVAPGTRTAVPVYWTERSLKRIDACCGGTAKAINTNGVAIGDAYDVQGRYSAFLWTPELGMQRIGPANGYSSAIAINDRGIAVIQTFPKIFLYDSDGLTKLTLAPKFPSHPKAINNCDVIVGAYGPFADKYRAFVWGRASGFQDLNSRIAPDSGWKLNSALDVNDNGEIIGRAEYRGEDDRGFLLIPEH